MRLVQLKVKPDRERDLKTLYDTRIIPELQKKRHCLFASLIFSTQSRNECISLTLWGTQADAEEYERGGFQELVEEIKPFLENSSEWKIRLSKDLTLEYQPVPEEPVVKSYVLPSSESNPPLAAARSSHAYIRIVSAKIQPGRIEEFERIYTQSVLPAVRKMKGCLYASLVEGANDRNEVISLTVWQSKEDADEYEGSGWFEALTNRVRHTFSELYQWKMKLEHDPTRQVVTSEDLKVEGYNVVTGKSFQ